MLVSDSEPHRSRYFRAATMPHAVLILNSIVIELKISQGFVILGASHAVLFNASSVFITVFKACWLDRLSG